MIKDVEHFFRCFSAIRYSSGENSLFNSELHFLMGLFDFLESTFLSFMRLANCILYLGYPKFLGKYPVIIECISRELFYDWITSLKIISSGYIHLPRNFINSFFK